MKSTYFTCNPLIIVAHIIILIIVTACSDNPANADKNDVNSRSDVTVSGTISDEHSGDAFFTATQVTFSLNLEDDGKREFMLLIEVFDDNGVSIPNPGVYTIGTPPDSDFQAFYVNTRLGGSLFGDHTYITLNPVSTGTLIVESSSENSIAGTFEFDAARSFNTDLTPIDPIFVTGSFSARRD